MGCYLCKQHVEGKPLMYKGRPLHSRCSAAVRSYNRQCKSKEARTKADAKFSTNPDAWREEVQSLLAPTGEVRSNSARLAIREQYQIQDNYEDQSHVGGRIWLTKTRFKRFQHLWEGIEPDLASDDFDDRLDAQSDDHENSDGEPQVMVRDNDKDQTRKGQRSGKITERGANRGERRPRTPNKGRDVAGDDDSGDQQDKRPS